jgi:hypothetical protein
MNLEQPSGMLSEEWIKLLLSAAAEVADGIALSEHEDGRDSAPFDRLAEEINTALANPVLA